MKNSGNSNAHDNTDLYESLRLELRRGYLILAVLAQLKTERYGYTLRKALADDGLAIDESTLYPLLRRLESQGLLVSEWPKKISAISGFTGCRRMASECSSSW